MNYKLLFELELEKNKQLEDEKKQLIDLVTKYKKEAKFWHKKSNTTLRAKDSDKLKIGILYGYFFR